MDRTIRVAPSGVALISITRHGITRAKPCGQKALLVGWLPNQGQQMGTPPRIERPLAKRALLDVHNTGFDKDFGCQAMICAPCKATLAVVIGLSTSKYFWPNSSSVWLTCACNLSRFCVTGIFSSIAASVCILILFQF